MGAGGSGGGLRGQGSDAVEGWAIGGSETRDGWVRGVSCLERRREVECRDRENLWRG